MIGTIAKVTRRKSSVNGNPAYRVNFTSGDEANTIADAMFSYGIENAEHRAPNEQEVIFDGGRICALNPTERLLSIPEYGEIPPELLAEIRHRAITPEAFAAIWDGTEQYSHPAYLSPSGYPAMRFVRVWERIRREYDV